MRIIAFVTDSPTVRVILIHLGAPGVDREAAGIPVKPAHRVERRVGAAAHRPEQRSGTVGHRAPRAGLIGNAWHSCGLVDDHQIAVGVHDRALGQRAAPQPEGPLVHDHHRARSDAARRVEAALAVDGDAAVGAQVACATTRCLSIPERRPGLWARACDWRPRAARAGAWAFAVLRGS
jgi:hypothetical protein